MGFIAVGLFTSLLPSAASNAILHSTAEHRASRQVSANLNPSSFSSEPVQFISNSHPRSPIPLTALLHPRIRTAALPTTPTALARLAATPAPAAVPITLPSALGLILRRRAHKGVVDGQRLVEQLRAVQGFDGGAGFGLRGVLDEDVALCRCQYLLHSSLALVYVGGGLLRRTLT